MKKYTFLILSLLTVIQLNGQLPEEKNNSKQKKWFNAIGGTALTSFGLHFDEGSRWDGLTFRFQFRRNIISFDDDASISISAPLGASIGDIFLPEPGYNNYGTGNNRREFVSFPFSIPLLLDFNIGMHSTYNNIDAYGFSLSAGALLQIIPNGSGDLKRDFGPAFKMEIKFPAKKHNVSIYLLGGLGLDDSGVLESFSSSLGAFYLLDYGN